MKSRILMVLAIFSFCLALAPVANCEEEEIISEWNHDRPLLEMAIATGTRVDVNSWPGNWFMQAKNLQEKTMMFKLWILGVDGSYTDAILPGISGLMALYDEEIRGATDDAARGKLFRAEAIVLIEIFQALDQQIKDWLVFEAEYQDAFRVFLDKEGIKDSSPDARPELHERFRGKFKKYAHHPGFFSLQVGWQRGDRSYMQYHEPELKQLKAILAIMDVKKNLLSLAGYENFFKSFSGRLARCLGGKE